MSELGNKRNEKKKKGKLGRGAKIALTTIIVVLVLFVALFAVAYGVFHYYYSLLNYVEIDNESIESFTGEIDETDDPEELTAETVDEGEMDTYLENQQGELSELIDGTTSSEDTTDGSSGSSSVTTTYDTSNLYNILVIGVDSRSNNFSGRSDMMMVITINKTSKKIVATSILRDSYVSIEGYQSNRLNAAYAYGGASLLISTIKSNIGISIDKYVTVNFFTVAAVVDYVGGVDLDVTAAEIAVMNNYIAAQNKIFGNATGTDLISESDAGYIHLNGNQALAYARNRYVGSDFSRTERQRKIVELVLEKLETMSLTELTSFAETFLPQVKTNLSESDVLDLVTLMLSIGNYSISTFVIPQSGTWSNATIRNMSVLKVDFVSNYKKWYAAVN